MRRPERQMTIREKVKRFREAVPELAMRTTCIVGFPGETADDFQQLMDFLEEIQFERVGAFTYSPQEGTRAAAMVDDVPEDVKRERLERLMELQRAITAERYESRIGSRVRALVEHGGDALEPARARLPWQADDIDGITLLDRAVSVGSFVEVEVTDVVDDYDFEARVIRELAPSAAPALSKPGRTLPLVSIGSFGR
jgi:ribosomal protein S12 methylthiotransferase